MTRLRRPGPRPVRRTGRRPGKSSVVRYAWAEGDLIRSDRISDVITMAARKDSKFMVLVEGVTSVEDEDKRIRSVRAIIQTTARRKGFHARTTLLRLTHVLWITASVEVATSTGEPHHQTPS